LLYGRSWPVPWLLAGGLHAGNLAEAVRLSGAEAVDVSSGVEDAPGRKSVARIRDFLATAAGL
jgi:phosphoribosylanthranilate isomerase